MPYLRRATPALQVSQVRWFYILVSMRPKPPCLLSVAVLASGRGEGNKVKARPCATNGAWHGCNAAAMSRLKPVASVDFTCLSCLALR